MANGHPEVDAEKLNDKGCEYGRTVNAKINNLAKEVDKMYNWIKIGITGIIGMFFTIIIMLSQMLWR